MIQVVKATGEIQPFSEQKVRDSIKRAGIANELQNQVVQHVESKLFDNIKTSEIYRHITEFLGQSAYPYSKARYSLKESIMALGPTGYPFEDFVADILSIEGYKTQVRTIIGGKCISHEIDVIAQKILADGEEKAMIEVKFHNGFGTRTDVQDALYTKARFDDVKEKYGFTNVWLVTNTKATLDAIQYGQCVGMKVISWNYPEEQSLRSIIEKSRLSLITALTTLSQNQKQELLQNHIVLCKDLYEKPSSLDLLSLPPEKKSQIIKEAEFVYKS
ncbi:MAG: ATP cone domain-containing protein [Candidatus Levybacteria bacterium]|nr:ATP cone domain-containing protein [Candidatus Levybacteria bacterium]